MTYAKYERYIHIRKTYVWYDNNILNIKRISNVDVYTMWTFGYGVVSWSVFYTLNDFILYMKNMYSVFPSIAQKATFTVNDWEMVHGSDISYSELFDGWTSDRLMIYINTNQLDVQTPLKILS